MRINLRTKMMVFAGLIAVIPLLVAGQSLIRVARDELKSAANEQLTITVRELTDSFNVFFEYSLSAPLDLVRNAIADDALNSAGKTAVLQRGIADLPDLVSLQVNVDGVPRPIMVTQEMFVTELSGHFDAPLDVLRIDPGLVDVPNNIRFRVSNIQHIEETGTWLATASMPIEGGIAGRKAALHAQINLQRLQNIVVGHRFTRTGMINVVNESGAIVFGTEAGEYARAPVLEAALAMLQAKSGTISVGPFELANGDITLSAMGKPRALPWAIIAEKSEADAYRPVTDMIENLIRWLAIGVAVAIAGAFLFSRQISRPILAIGNIATEIADGNLDVRVEGVRSKDEIGDLAGRFNSMIVQLNERFELQKFVSAGTMQAIQSSEENTVSLGGERRRVAILFADIRGYTAFSENRDPEEVVDVLNNYFQRLSDIVVEFDGDIDKFVGDQIMAVFIGERMSENAVRCSLAITDAMDTLAVGAAKELRIGIGVDVGEVVVGAMGAMDRKDFTVLGDHVNLAARLCSKAEPDETLVTRNVIKDIPKQLRASARKLKPIRVKGKTGKIVIYGYGSPE